MKKTMMVIAMMVVAAQASAAPGARLEIKARGTPERKAQAERMRSDVEGQIARFSDRSILLRDSSGLDKIQIVMAASDEAVKVVDLAINDGKKLTAGKISDPTKKLLVERKNAAVLEGLVHLNDLIKGSKLEIDSLQDAGDKNYAALVLRVMDKMTEATAENSIELLEGANKQIAAGKSRGEALKISAEELANGPRKARVDIDKIFEFCG